MSQHDETRKILELIRESSRSIIKNDKKLLVEQDSQCQEEKDLDPGEIQEEERKFRDTINS